MVCNKLEEASQNISMIMSLHVACRMIQAMGANGLSENASTYL